MITHKDQNQYEILIVEDNEGDFTLIQDFLEERFLTPKIYWAKNFKEANATLISTDCKIDLVLLDLSLPDKSGEGLIIEIIPLCHQMPLIVLTGYSDIEFGAKSLSLGVSDYLIKDELNATSLYKSILYSLERKKTLIQLETSERRYSDLFHFSPIPMWVYDINTLRFLDVNASAIENYGYCLEEFLEMSILEIRPVEDVPSLLEKIELLNTNNNSTNPPETYRHKKKNGEIFFVEIQIKNISFQGVLARIILASDITERFTYIEAIEKQNKKLKDIAWIQSHVVRAPLARMMGLINLMKHQGFNDPDNEELYDYLLTSAIEFDEIIKEITDKSELIKLENLKQIKLF
jgi:PAS domain S-box-containing protein